MAHPVRDDVPSEEAPPFNRNSSVESVRPGMILDGKYRLRRRIGEGGMAAVFSGFDEHLERRVAIKVVNGEHLGNENRLLQEIVQRTLLEAKTVARLQSSNIVQVLDMGSAPNGLPYIVLEYLDGEDLAEFLCHSGPLQPSLAIDIGVQLCDALACAHRAGVVHRDLKPENVFIVRQQTGQPQVKLLDFGIAKDPIARRNFSNPNLTQSRVIGSPHYMAPEQMIGSPHLDHRADIWSVGVLLYQMLTGQRPFDGESCTDTCREVLTIEPVPVEMVRSEVPKALGQVVARCLRKSPDDRYVDIDEVIVALQATLPGSGQAQIRAAVSEALRSEQKSSPASADEFAALQPPDSRVRSRAISVEVESDPLLGIDEQLAAQDNVPTLLSAPKPRTELSREDSKPSSKRWSVALVAALFGAVSVSAWLWPGELRAGFELVRVEAQRLFEPSASF